jgi:hypothetical protein
MIKMGFLLFILLLVNQQMMDSIVFHKVSDENFLKSMHIADRTLV